MPLYSFIFTQHFVLYCIDAIVISHIVFVLSILLIEMYAELALPELPDEPHQPVHTWQYNTVK